MAFDIIMTRLRLELLFEFELLLLVLELCNRWLLLLLPAAAPAVPTGVVGDMLLTMLIDPTEPV